MVSRYSIIQYVPNPIADERINIGIVAFNDRLVKTRFVQSWKRVACFAKYDSDVDFLKDFQCKIEKLASLNLLFSDDANDIDRNLDRLNRVAKSWNNSVQFTEPRGSLEDVETLLDDISEDFLIEPSQPKRLTVRDRQAAVKVTKRKVRSVLESFGKSAKEYYKTDHGLQGELSNNEFDVAVANGKTFLALQAISFEVNTNDLLISSTSWRIADVRKIQPNVPIGVVMLPPVQESTRFEQSKKIYKDCQLMYESLGAETIQENDIESWTNDRLGKDFAALVS